MLIYTCIFIYTYLYLYILMNGYECNGTDIFMRLEMECSIQRGKAELNRTFLL